ncbi:unnamed protein product [Rotaria sp. Silwood2]|nr:unnamed protein product [Rotaria sp. Silwood2]CAF2712272.1 unnamed protein product [Rotaria sp. Silwood2]CAF2931809.1 unnamed protein product [Rotaria sp. Silwood2]CAF2953495.1 unnamed protein product [Rotaria sp. Silwood2]CAF3920612.1 unnamed protein product [Rotaria sp. Silwood2]
MSSLSNSSVALTQQSVSVTQLQKESTTISACASSINQTVNHECITFVWLDLRRDPTGTFVGTLRAINDCVRTFTDVSACLDFIKSSHEKIFFISSSSNGELLATVHLCIAVEAIFVLDPDTNSVRGDFPKLIDILTQQEELLRVLRITLDTFEHIQLERFVFETDKMFIWWQLWKEEITSQKAKQNSKSYLVEQARNYYRGNSKRLKLIDEFDKSYRANDSLRWCFRSPFPSRPLRYALMSPTLNQLSSYQFLITDAVRILQQQSKRTGHGQVYRGMKLPNELVDMFETHMGELVCVNGFFMCTKLRNIELQSAASPGYRSDLSSVLFKIDFDAAARLAEVPMENGSIIVVFDVATSFRVVCVNRGTMSIIKMKTTSDEGKKLALEFKEKNKGKTIKMLLDELSAPPKPATPPPATKIEVRNEPIQINNSQISEDELEAKKHLKRGDIDQAIAAYQRIRPMPVRILKLIGQLSADEKEDYDTAVECYRQALKMQEEAGEDIADTLSRLGTIYHHRGEYELALKCHSRALALYESAHPRVSNSISTSLTSISNTRRAQKDLNGALDYAQRAWTLCESSGSENDAIVAKSLALLTNIHHDLGDDAQALKLGTRALILFERVRSSNPSQSAELLNTLGLVQMNLGELSEARHYFERALKIYSHIAPLGQVESAKTKKNLQCVLEMQQNIDNLQHYS